jgi:predicted Zn finger-like uncharacterized protein
MILTCPTCATRYRVSDEEFDNSAGRTVRCANCGHSWYETPSAQPAPADPEAPGEPSADNGSALKQRALEAAPQPIPRLEVPPRPSPASSRKGPNRSAALPWVVALIVLLVAIVVAGFLIRRQLAAVWPSAARLYALTGQSAPPSGTGLTIRKIAPSRTVEGLMIDGEIANLGDVPRDVPRLRLALQDSVDKEVQFETVDPPKPRLEPGEVAHFETQFAHPPDDATGVVVTFASP